MTPPALTANASVYRSTRTYIAATGPPAKRLLTQVTPCDRPYNDCVTTAQTTFSEGMHRCGLLAAPYAQGCSSSFQARLASDLAACEEAYACDAALCGNDVVSKHGYHCCPQGTQQCAGGCVLACPPNKRILPEDSACQCVCDWFLQDCSYVFPGGQTIRDSDTCACRCQTETELPCSLTGAHRNPSTCICECDPGDIVCNGACVNPERSPNCGGCGNVCAIPGMTGRQAAAPCCPPSGANMTWWCDNAPASWQKCGFCGQAKACGPGEQCCSSGGGGYAYHCADTNWDSANCGSCGNTCTGGQFCSSGHCVCHTNEFLCGGKCIPLCTGGKVCDGHGTCVCPSGKVDCGGFCIDPCTGGKVCDNAGHCVCPTGQIDCASKGKCCPPAACCPDGCCPSGETCCAGQDGKECCPPARCCPQGCCPAGKTCCAGTCVDLQTDINHCGSCPTQCTGGSTTDYVTGTMFPYPAACAGGHCVCPTGATLCGRTWCMPNVHPTTGLPMTCCAPRTLSDGTSYGCPLGLTCCGTGTGCCL